MLLATRELEYDGLNRRIRKVVSNCGDGLVPGSDDLDGNGTPDATGIPFANRSEHYYYAGWRVIEERDNNGSAGRVLAQTVYGTEYIDEPVCRDRNLDVSTDGTPASDDCLDTASTRYFYHQDANYRVAALTNESGTVVERYEYEAYGEPRIYAGQPAGGTYESGALVSTSYVGNPLMHQGLRRDDETGLHENRYRMLHSRLGRFMQRDPAGYVDGLNTYAYLKSRPQANLDPIGRLASPQDDYLWKFHYEQLAQSFLDSIDELLRKLSEALKAGDAAAVERIKDDINWFRELLRNTVTGLHKEGVRIPFRWMKWIKPLIVLVVLLDPPTTFGDVVELVSPIPPAWVGIDPDAIYEFIWDSMNVVERQIECTANPQACADEDPYPIWSFFHYIADFPSLWGEDCGPYGGP